MRIPEPMVFRKLIPARMTMTVTPLVLDTLRASCVGDGDSSSVDSSGVSGSPFGEPGVSIPPSLSVDWWPLDDVDALGGTEAGVSEESLMSEGEGGGSGLLFFGSIFSR